MGLCSLQLDTWFNNLPANFLVWARSSSPLPHIIVLHIWYWSLLIYLHQPFYTLAQSTSTRLPVGDLSVKMCDRASHKIVQLVGMYDVHYGLRFFPRNMIEVRQFKSFHSRSLPLHSILLKLLPFPIVSIPRILSLYKL